MRDHVSKIFYSRRVFMALMCLSFYSTLGYVQLWFTFVLGLNFIFHLSLGMIMSLKQTKMRLKPRIKLNRNTHRSEKLHCL